MPDTPTPAQQMPAFDARAAARLIVDQARHPNAVHSYEIHSSLQVRLVDGIANALAKLHAAGQQSTQQSGGDAERERLAKVAEAVALKGYGFQATKDLTRIAAILRGEQP